MIELRPYQQDAVDAVCESFRRHRSALAVAPTGTGKTIIFGAIAQRCAHRLGRVLVLAERRQLVTQTASRLRDQWGLAVQVEMGNQHATLAGADVVVASVQSMAARLDRFDSADFKLVIVDEAHHAVAPTYKRVIDYFADAYVAGLTATADRKDGQSLAQVFDVAAFEMSPLEAIEGGWISPIVQQRVVVDSVNLDMVATKGRGRSEDFDDEALAAQFEAEAALHAVAGPLLSIAAERPTIVFASSVAHAHSLARVLNDQAGRTCAAAIDGTTPEDDRRKVVRQFAAGEIQHLVNCALLTEGFDAPATSCVALVRPTKSRGLYTQMVGRGFRLAPGKTDLLVLDFVGVSNQHRLVSVADILDGSLDPAAVDRVRRITEASPEIPVHEAIAQAEQEALAERRAALRSRSSWRSVQVSPFEALGIDARPGRGGTAPATASQVHGLRKWGVPDDVLERLNRLQASLVMDAIVERHRSGQVTRLKMIRTLANYGLNTDITHEQASAAIGAIARNGWTPPPSVLKDPALNPDAEAVAKRTQAVFAQMQAMFDHLDNGQEGAA